MCYKVHAQAQNRTKTAKAGDDTIHTWASTRPHPPTSRNKIFMLRHLTGCNHRYHRIPQRHRRSLLQSGYRLIDCFDDMPITGSIDTSPTTKLSNTIPEQACATFRMERCGLFTPTTSPAEGFFDRIKREFWTSGTTVSTRQRTLFNLVRGRTHQDRIGHEHLPTQTRNRPHGILKTMTMQPQNLTSSFNGKLNIYPYSFESDERSEDSDEHSTCPT